VIVFEDEVFVSETRGPEIRGVEIPPELRRCCCDFAKRCRTPLLGIDFFPTPASAWTFSHATPAPDLRVGGEPLLQALARRFSKGEN